MHIEIFTDGRVFIDGQEADPSWKAEKILKEFLSNPNALAARRPKLKAM